MAIETSVVSAIDLIWDKRLLPFRRCPALAVKPSSAAVTPPPAAVAVPLPRAIGATQLVS
jgi:hypothetical protein